MRMRRVTWPGGKGSSKTTYLESATLFAYLLYNLWGYNDD